jgi:glycosyltransferase involved in cell wall biosynthesis
MRDSKNQSLISVIIPTYNRPWGLKVAIESVLTQTYQNYELIIIDDYSSLETCEVVAKYSDHCIIYRRQSQNVGMVRNWGAGLKMARGEFVVFLCDDDYLMPGFIKSRLQHISGRTDVAVVFSNYQVRDRGEALLSINTPTCPSRKRLDSSRLLTAALAQEWFVGASMYRRSALLDVWDAVTNDDLVLDLGMNVRLALRQRSHGVYSPVADFVMTAHSEQNSQSKRLLVYEQVINTLDRIIEEYEGSPHLSMLKEARTQWLISWARRQAADNLIHEARAKFLKAVRYDPLAWQGWRQLCISLLWPKKMVLTAKKQWEG